MMGPGWGAGCLIEGEIVGPQEVLDEGVKFDVLVEGRGRRNLACKALALRARL